MMVLTTISNRTLIYTYTIIENQIGKRIHRIKYAKYTI